MPWILESRACAAAWPALLAFRDFLSKPEAAWTDAVTFAVEGGQWQFRTGASSSPPGTPSLTVPLDGELPEGEGSGAGFARSEDAALFAPLRLYLPLLLGARAARKRGGVHVTAHLAQTLDGRIACRNGHSQWIGNEANLCHAHRLRALHDAIVVGRLTVEIDDPQLTVRRVEGRDPARVVLSGKGGPSSREGGFRVFGGAGATLVSGEPAGAEADDDGDTIRLPRGPDGRIVPSLICGALQARGIGSVFLEGGGQTLSTFLQHGAVDVLHLHLASMILGSGRDAFTLREAASIQEAQRVRTEAFFLDGEILLECRPAARG